MVNTSKIILTKLISEHRGKEKAIRREDLLSFAQIYQPDMTDRELRNIYSQLPVCVCERGIFYPIRGQEVQDFLVYLRKKAMPMMVRSRMVATYHHELLDSFQMELFQ